MSFGINHRKGLGMKWFHWVGWVFMVFFVLGSIEKSPESAALIFLAGVVIYWGGRINASLQEIAKK